MNGADPLTFHILGRTCVITLPPTLDGVPPANDADDEEPDETRVVLHPVAPSWHAAPGRCSFERRRP